MRRVSLILCILLTLLQRQVATAQSSNNIPGLSTYFDEAYWRYPNIPKGILEAAAYAASRMSNLQPQNNDANCTAMPERYGLFALVENGRGYFKNNLIAVCNASGLTPDQLRKDVRLQILAVAKFLGREATARRMSMQVSAEEFASVVERLSEIPDDTSAVNTYAHQLYIFEIYELLQKGFTSGSLTVAPTPVDLEKIFPTTILQQLRAKAIAINYEADKVEVPSGPADIATGPRSTDYRPAVFIPASTGNYQSGRNGSSITNITIHTTQGSYASTISWFKNPYAVVSSHYVIRSSDGQVTQMVRESDMAYHTRSANPYAIGIEHEGFAEQGTKWYSEQLYQSSASLVRGICVNYGIDRAACFRGQATAATNFLPITVRIKGHQHYNGNTHTDPGKYWNWGKYADLLLDKVATEQEGKYSIVSNGVYRINNGNKVLNTASKLTQSEWNGRDGQRWLFEHTGNGWYKITSKQTGRALDSEWRIYQTEENNGLRIVNKTGGKLAESAQTWNLTPVSANNITTGIYRLRMARSNQVLSTVSCSSSAGAAIQSGNWKGLDCQRWQVEPTIDGFFRLVQKQNGLVMDVEDCNREQGGNIVQFNWMNIDCQKWGFQRMSDSSWKIVSKGSGKALEIAGNQQWIMELIRGEDSMSIAPNPVSGHDLRVQYFLNNTRQPATLILSDTYGRIIQQRRVLLQQGNNRLIVNTSLLKAGVYLVTINLDGTRGGVSRKIIRQ